VHVVDATTVRRQRRITPRLQRSSTAHRRIPQRDHDPPAGTRVLSQPDRIYFSVLQRKLLTPDDLPDLHVLANRLTAFETRYNTAARPFDWRFKRNDLSRLLTRIAA
jgi:hypothetical protein